MRITSKLLTYLNRVFDKDPEPFVALTFSYAGTLTWSIDDLVLTTQVVGGPGVGFSVDLSQYTLDSLATFISGRTGYTVGFIDPSRRLLSARVLLDGAGGDDGKLLGYTSLLWALFEAAGVQLQQARDQIDELLRQMSTRTASGAWLDELGGYYKVPRKPGEADASYGPRIIAETLRPVSNNVAIERAIEDFTGQSCEVVDVTIYRGVFPVYDGTITHNAAYNYNTVGKPEYGLFDIKVGYDLLGGGDITGFLDTVRDVVSRLRAAGTHLRALNLATGASTILTDTVTPPTDSPGAGGEGVITLSDAAASPTDPGYVVQVGMGMSDTVTAPTDAVTGSVLKYLQAQDGTRIQAQDGTDIQMPVGDLFV